MKDIIKNFQKKKILMEFVIISIRNLFKKKIINNRVNLQDLQIFHN